MSVNTKTDTTKEKTARLETGITSIPWAVKETGFDCSWIEYDPQEVQEMDEVLGKMEQEIQKLFQHGTSQNKDLFAFKLHSQLMDLQDVIRKGRMM